MGSNFYEMLEKSLGEPEVEELFLPSLSETELIVELLRALPDELLFLKLMEMHGRIRIWGKRPDWEDLCTTASFIAFSAFATTSSH